jgi:hypothetical protein
MADKDTETTAPAVAYTYIGEGSYLHGVPARDLSKDDLDMLPSDVSKKDLEASGLYKKGVK